MTGLTMRLVRDASGSVRHVPTPYVAKPATKGRKTRPAPDPIKTNGESAAEELRLLVERGERLAEAARDAQEDLREFYAEASGRGYTAKTIRTIMAIRLKDKAAFQEEEALLELYRQHLGML